MNLDVWIVAIIQVEVDVQIDTWLSGVCGLGIEEVVSCSANLHWIGLNAHTVVDGGFMSQMYFGSLLGV